MVCWALTHEWGWVTEPGCHSSYHCSLCSVSWTSCMRQTGTGGCLGWFLFHLIILWVKFECFSWCFITSWIVAWMGPIKRGKVDVWGLETPAVISEKSCHPLWMKDLICTLVLLCRVCFGCSIIWLFGLWLMKILCGVRYLRAVCSLGTTRNENLVLLGKPKKVLNVFRIQTIYFCVIYF